MAWHATPLATWRAKRSKIWIFLILNLSFFPIYLYPNTSLIKKKRTGVKRQSNWKYLRDFTWTRVTKISRISWMRHLPVNWFFTVKGNLFSFIARIPTVLRGRQYIPRLCLWARQTTIFSTYSCERLNRTFPSLPKFGHIRWPSYVKGYSFLDGSLLGQHTYLVEKNLSLPCEEGQVILAIRAKEHFNRRCMCRFSCLPWARDRFEEWLKVPKYLRTV